MLAEAQPYSCVRVNDNKAISPGKEFDTHLGTYV